MKNDIGEILREWPASENENIRKITDSDGVEKVQVRVDQGAFQGILQMDLDGRLQRTPNAVNDLIRQHARACRAPLIDLDAVGRELSRRLTGRDLPPGAEMFLDHCHPNKVWLIEMGEAIGRAMDAEHQDERIPLAKYEETIRFKDFIATLGAICFYLENGQPGQAELYWRQLRGRSARLGLRM